MEPNTTAILAVLTYIDQHFLGSTTCVSRWRVLEKIHRRLPEDVRSVLLNFLSLYVLLQRAMQNPNNRPEPYNSFQIENSMQRLFAKGSDVFADTYLESIGYMVMQNSEGDKSEHANRECSNNSHLGKRKAASETLEGEEITANKSARFSHEASPGRATKHVQAVISDNSRAKSLAATIPAATVTPQAKRAIEPHTGEQAIEDRDNNEIENLFVKIAMLIEKVPSHAFSDRGDSRMAQLMTEPTDGLKKMYAHALGKDAWKPIAIELQSADALVAKDFLRCIFWSFLILNVFGPQKMVSECKHHTRREPPPFDVHNDGIGRPPDA